MDTARQQSRKLEHIEHALKTGDGPNEAGFSDIHLVHDCLAGLALADIDLKTEVAGIKLLNPVIINALTGGDEAVSEINRRLALAAKLTGSAMAIGSQHVAVKNPSLRKSFTVVRENNPDGVIFANIGAYAAPKDAQTAIDMLGAQALQIHLNIGQELAMQEGDRDFRNYLENIKRIVSAVDVPVIVKETGCGIAVEAASKLIAAGVRAIDVSGSGGTNFIAIEYLRKAVAADSGMLSWGLSTAASTLEIAGICRNRASMVVSGGVRSALDIVKALACGGQAVGMAAPFLRLTKKRVGEKAVVTAITELLKDVAMFTLMTGAANISQLQEKPIVVTGKTREWLCARGITVDHLGYARGDQLKQIVRKDV